MLFSEPLGSENADHTGLANVAMDLAAEFSKFAGDKLGRAMLLEAKFGVCVQIVPPRGHVVVKQIDEMWNLHDERLHGMLTIEAPTLGDARK
jgi:hypothetical protein